MGTCKDAITPNQLATLQKLNLKGDDLTTKQKTERTRLQKKKDNPKITLHNLTYQKVLKLILEV
jgi:hypothetical protein